MIFYVILIYDPAERTANIHAVPANMLLNPSLELIFSRLFMTFTLLTLQESSTTCKNSTVSTSLGNFQRKNWINNIVSVFHFPFLFSRKEIIISVVHWTFPSAHTAAMCPANWIWYCYLRQSSNQPLSLIREAIEKRFNCGFCHKPKFQMFWLWYDKGSIKIFMFF